ncbi:MAG: hypothetical protein JW828_06675 [Sedimentisphaerales bacterium]|nr:hypothetical protein [Sedimentisphaerales bacterium]
MSIIRLTVVPLALVLCLACGLQAGTIYGWGNTEFPPEGDTYVGIAAGQGFSLAVTEEGVVDGWGDNTNGQLNLPEGSNYAQVAAGRAFTIALLKDGSLTAVGRGVEGQTTVPAGNNYVFISAGAFHGVALKSDKTIAAWGKYLTANAASPVGNDFKAVDAGMYFDLAIREDGSLHAWGENQDNVITDLPAGNDFIAVSAGGSDPFGAALYQHGMALRKNGTIAVWGDDTFRQVSDAPTEGGFIAIAAGGTFCAAIKADGSLIAWGENTVGQTVVPSGNAFARIAAGTDHGLALEQFGTLELLNPLGGEMFSAGSVQPIRWQPVGGAVGAVTVEYTLDDGANWYEMSPPANESTIISEPNSISRYDWFVPLSNSSAAKVRVISALSEAQSGAFTIFHCNLRADANGDCVVDIQDLAIMTEEWLRSEDPLLGPAYPGDFDGDGDIDDDDLSIFDAAWMSQRGDGNWNEAVDISMPADGKIDFDDWFIFSQNYLMGL